MRHYDATRDVLPSWRVEQLDHEQDLSELKEVFARMRSLEARRQAVSRAMQVITLAGIVVLCITLIRRML
jgi:hypothetical protein